MQKTTKRLAPSSKSPAKADPVPAEMTRRDGVEHAGEIVTWTVHGRAIKFDAIVAALKSVGLPDHVARKMLPKNAFTRAAKALQQERLIHLKSREAGISCFQLNRVVTAQNADLEFPKEADLFLDEAAGTITCPAVPELATFAQAKLDEAIATRGAGDVTQMVQRVFEEHGDLFAIRDQGGAYFVPAQYEPLVDQVQAFLEAVGGTIRRFAVPKGSPKTDSAIKVSLVDGIRRMVEDHVAAIEAYDDKTRGGTVERRMEAIQTTRFKIEAYRSYLADQVATLGDALDGAADLLLRKAGIISLAKEAKGAQFTADCDACGRENPVRESDTEMTCRACGHVSPLE